MFLTSLPCIMNNLVSMAVHLLWLHYEIIVVINGVPRNFVFGNVKFMHLTNPHLLLIIF